MRKFIIIALMLFISIGVFAQQRTITGKVINKNTRQPLSGVTVQAKNRNTLTDSSGQFSILVTVPEVLHFSYVGLDPASLTITGETQNLSVELSEGASELTQVVVTGYKSERKVDLTGA